MKSTELRIGNYVNDVASQPFKVAANCLVALVQCEVAQKINLGYNGIPLTEKWLTDFGFRYRNENRGLGSIMDYEDPDKDDWKYNMSVAFQCEKHNKEIIYLHFLQHATTNHIKYVHQLQNLYFALTGSELILKP